MEYSVGSIADLITGKNTPNKPKVVRKEFKVKSKPKAATGEDRSTFKPHKKIKSKVNDFQNEKPKEKFEKSGKVRKIKKFNSAEKKFKTGGKRFDGNPKLNKAEVEEEPEQVNDKNAQKRIKKKRREESEELYKDRTIFVGNIPLESTKEKLKRFFRKFGKIENIRIRGVAPADPKVPKKVAMIKKEFHPDRKSLYCYVRFETGEEAQKALKLNGFVYEDHHLRVGFAGGKEKPDQSKAIFVGNISFKAEEDELWELFAPCGAISSVRLVRDSRTGMGRGFGYVNFESKDGVELALLMDKPSLKGRELRVSLCNNSSTSVREKKKKERKVLVRPSRKRIFDERRREVAENNQDIGEEQDVGEIEEKAEPQKKKKRKHSENVEDDKAAVKAEQSFVGTKFSEKKKKKKLTKGLMQKKKLIKQLTPKQKVD